MPAAAEEVEVESGAVAAVDAEEGVFPSDLGDGGRALGEGAVEGRVGGGGAPGLAHGAEAADGAGRQADEDLQDHAVWQRERARPCWDDTAGREHVFVLLWSHSLIFLV